MLLIHPALRLGTLLLHYIIAISSFFVSIHVFFSYYVHSLWAAVRAKFLPRQSCSYCSHFSYCYSLLYFFLNEINDDDDDDDVMWRRPWWNRYRGCECDIGSSLVDSTWNDWRPPIPRRPHRRDTRKWSDDYRTRTTGRTRTRAYLHTYNTASVRPEVCI